FLTTPVASSRYFPSPSLPALAGRCRTGHGMLAQSRLHPRKIVPRLSDPHRILDPPGGKLKPKVKQLLLELLFLFDQLCVSQLSELFHLHRSTLLRPARV